MNSSRPRTSAPRTGIGREPAVEGERSTIVDPLQEHARPKGRAWASGADDREHPGPARDARGERRGRATPGGRTANRGNEEQPTIRSTQTPELPEARTEAPAPDVGTRDPDAHATDRRQLVTSTPCELQPAGPSNTSACAPRGGPATVERASTRFVAGPAGTRQQGESPPRPPGLATGIRRTGGQGDRGPRHTAWGAVRDGRVWTGSLQM